jgi:hypothetical protein
MHNDVKQRSENYQYKTRLKDNMEAVKNVTAAIVPPLVNMHPLVRELPVVLRVFTD